MNAVKRFAWALLSAIGLAAVCLPAMAGGILGDIVNTVVPGAGTKLDDAHRQIKNAIPPYKALEEGASKVVNEAAVQTTAPLLQELIARSRDDALRAGVKPIPPDIRRNLMGFIPDQALDAVRYRVQGGGDLTLQVNAIRYGEAQAITLDYVVVFKETNDALYNPTLWAHELTHVSQYQRMGIRDFAIRYVRNYRAIEDEAYQAETRYVAWASLKNSQQWASSGGSINAAMVNRPVAAFSFDGVSNTCGTAITSCQMNGSAPVGTPCWCNTPMGAATGSLVPNRGDSGRASRSPVALPTQAPVGFPSGYGMQVCGCWGPNPSQVVAEPRCATGGVRLNICPGQCAPGHPPYAYVCR
jgi:Domain of unknown function (DUF4157)